MSLKAFFLSVGYVVAWFVLLPMLVIVGGSALFAYAVFAELGAFITGIPSKTLDKSVARDIASRMCGVQIRNARR